jgi:hypothetical protein
LDLDEQNQQMKMDVDVMPNAKLAYHISFDNLNGWLIAL